MLKILNTLCLIFISSTFFSQELMTIGQEKVTVNEFIKIYQKNNNSKASFSKSDLNEYIDLFTLFKMKLQEARRMRLDTLPEIKSDYTKYTDQLIQNQIIDKNYVDNLLLSQYEHMKYDVKIAHIMVKCPQNSSPSDSLLAYNKLKFLREKATKDNFSTLAKESSEDQSSAPNGGVLGYITAFMTFPEFEDRCYNTPVGQISPIFRTQFGFHILYIIDKRPARARVKVAHIFMKKTETNEEEKLMKQAFASINSKKNSFEDAVKTYSQDASSKEKNGELPEFGVSEMVQEFEDQCFGLKNVGDISNPFKTEYGWHLVKLIEKKPLSSFELSKDMIKQKMERDPRLTNLRAVAYEKMIKKYNLQENNAVLTSYIAPIQDTFFAQKNWVLKTDKTQEQKVLFTFMNSPYTLSSFIDFTNQNYATAFSRNKSEIFNAVYAAYKERVIWDATKKLYQKENEDYRNLESEYMNGLLIFDIMEREIWKKAVLDTVGAKKLYEKVKNDYWYKERVVVEGIKTRNADLTKPYLTSLNPISAKKLLEQIKKTKDSNEFVYYERTLEKGEYSSVDMAMTNGGKPFVFSEEDKSTILAKIVKTIPPSIKPFNEIRGRVQNLYQNQLEKEWNASLRAKYPVNINVSELNKLIKN